MATYIPPKRATSYRFWVSLVDQANTKKLKSSPTLAAGDVKVSKDGGATANITTLPVVTPAASVFVQVDLSATEMTADNVSVTFIDAAGAEWCDLFINLQTAARQIDDLAFPNTSGRGMDIDATGGAEITADQSVNVNKWLTATPDALISGRVKSTAAIVSGTADSGTTSTLVDAERTEADTDYWKDQIILFTSGTLAGVAKRITGFTPATDTISFEITPVAVGTHTYEIIPMDSVNVGRWVGTVPATLAPLGYVKSDVYAWLNTQPSVLITPGRVDSYLGSAGANTINVNTLADGAINAATMAADVDIYNARITLIDDNGGTTDRYVVNWYKNGQDVTTGITVPTIQVVKASDGTDLIASVAMTEIGTTGAYKYDAVTTARIVSGAAYFVIVGATIGGSARTYRQGWGRDS